MTPTTPNAGPTSANPLQFACSAGGRPSSRAFTGAGAFCWILLSTLAVVLQAHAGTFTSDFTKGVNTNYWGLWTSFPAGVCTNINDAQGVTFQRIAGSGRQSFSAGLSLGPVAMRKITTDGGGYMTGDFVVTMTYSNLNNFVSSSGDFWTWASNQLKLFLQWGDGSAPERVHVVQVWSFSRNYYGWYQGTGYQGSVMDGQFPAQGGQLLNIRPAAPASSATLTMARTNGVLSYYLNNQQIGVGEGPSAFTSNDIWSVNLKLQQGIDAAPVGVTLQSCVISGPNIKDYPPQPPQLKLVSASGGNFGFVWDATPGQAYQVQTATNLTSGGWANLGSSFIAKRSPVAVTNSIGTDPARFYRVQAVGN